MDIFDRCRLSLELLRFVFKDGVISISIDTSSSCHINPFKSVSDNKVSFVRF